MTTKAQRESERVAATEELRGMFPTGSVVHTVVRHVSASGMSRAISVLYADSRDGIQDVSWLVARATGFKLDPRHPGLKVQGAGMDMAFHLAYTLAQGLHGDGYALGHRSI